MKHIGWSIVIVFAYTVAHAASFDCAKSQSKIEKLICGNAELSGLDDLLHDVYQRQWKRLSDTTRFVQDQREWLKATRNACVDAACLKKVYVDRINEIGMELDENDVSARSLLLKCDFSTGASAPLQRVSIEGAVFGRGQPAAVTEFSKNPGKPESVSLLVKPGEFAECVYPSGFRVRVKVGEGMSYPYGECGADAPVFMSLWVNQRKAASRLWFAGHCREMRDEQPVIFRISAKPCGPSGAVCTDFPELNKYPVDLVEYPEHAGTAPKVGDVELVQGGGVICTAALDKIRKGYFGEASTMPDDREFARPEWGDVSVELPRELAEDGQVSASSGESTYDFDNDGKLDRVINLPFMTSYMEGAALLVQPGTSPTSFAPAAPLLDKSSMFIPCQVSGGPSDLHECPPLSQTWDEAGFSFGAQKGGGAVRFRARYTAVVPFTFRGASYIFADSRSEDTAGYSAILKPLPKRKFEHACLFKVVEENF